MFSLGERYWFLFCVIFPTVKMGAGKEGRSRERTLDLTRSDVCWVPYSCGRFENWSGTKGRGSVGFLTWVLVVVVELVGVSQSKRRRQKQHQLMSH